MQHLTLHAIVIPDALYGRVKRLPRLKIEPNDVSLRVLVLQRDERVLHVKPAVRSEGLGDHQERVSERLHAHLGAALGGLLRALDEMRRARDLKRTGTRYERGVFDTVLDGAQTVAQRVLDLLRRVCVWALDEQRHALGVLHFVHEREFLFAERVFVHESSPPKNVRRKFFDRVLCETTTYQLEPVDGVTRVHIQKGNGDVLGG